MKKTDLRPQLQAFQDRCQALHFNLPPNLHNFASTQSQKPPSYFNLSQLIVDFLSFFNENKPLLELDITKGNTDSLPVLACLYQLYNELVQCADLWRLEKWEEAHEQQTAWLNNKAWQNLLKQLPTATATEYANRARVLALFSCLFKAYHIGQDHQTHAVMLELGRQLEQAQQNKQLSNKLYQYFLYAQGFYHFMTQQKDKAHLKLACLVHHASPNNWQQDKNALSLEFCALGQYSHLIAPFPNEYRAFAHESIAHLNWDKAELALQIKRMTHSKGE